MAARTVVLGAASGDGLAGRARAPRTAARADKLAAWGTVTAEVAMAGAGG